MADTIALTEARRMRDEAYAEVVRAQTDRRIDATAAKQRLVAALDRVDELLAGPQPERSFD